MNVPEQFRFLLPNIQNCYWLHNKPGFPGGLAVKNPPANAGDVGNAGSIPGSGRSPWRRAWQPTPVFLAGESHGRRSLAGYSPWGHKESDTTEQLTHTLKSLVYLAQGKDEWEDS